LFVVGSDTETQDTESAGRPPDWRERKKALDIRQSWIVEAPAGSGKTGLLIQRYLKLLGDESITEPEQVLTITFTVKATGEIRERVMAQLEKVGRKEPLQSDSEFERETRVLATTVMERDRMLGWGLLERPRRLKVRTIDSVCAEIAGSLPVLSGGGVGLSPLLDASGLHHEAARRTLMQLGGKDAALNAALRTVLLHRDGNLVECERLLAEMLALRDQWGKLVPLGEQKLDDAYLDETVLPWLERTLEQAICAALTQLAESVPEDFLNQLAALASSLAEIEPYEYDVSPIANCAGRKVPGTDAGHLDHWRALIHLLVAPSTWTWRKSFAKNTLGFETTKEQKKRLGLVIDQILHREDLLKAMRRVDCLPPAKYPREQWEVVKALFRVLSRALVELQLVFAERGECDFAELGLLAKTALQREGGVHDLEAALGMKLQHLLVDEMQDTSTSQYELIELLTQNWDGQSQTIFLVGDPKQSIYLFRQARVERFVRTMLNEQLGELPVGCLRLTANFRSQRGLVDAFNEDFSLLFPRDVTTANPEEVEYVSANAVRGPSDSGALNVVWHGNGLPAGDAIARRRRAKTDAEAARGIIEQWRSRPLPGERTEPWKMAVLVRSRNHLTDIVTELKKDHGQGAIPFRAVDIEVLGERREVLDLFALTRALLHPADRVAWLAVLHAPWCGLGLSKLHVLTGADDDTWSERTIEDVLAERGHLLDEDSCERLQRIWPVLQAAAAQRGRLTTAQWVERTWRSLGGDAYLETAEMANARRYLQLLDEVEEQTGMLDLSLLKTRLDRLYAEAIASVSAVDLMTIHGAKGLEWDVVIVPGLEKKARVSSGRLLMWNEIDSDDTTAAHVALAPIVGKGEESRELNSWLNSIEKTRDAAERKRLFYVACTRAREELHLFAAPEVNSKGAVSLAYGSLLSAAWPAAERHFAVKPEVTSDARKMFAISNEVTPSSPTADEFIGDIAAGATSERPAMLERLPLAFSPSARFAEAQKLSYGDAGGETETAHFERPEGSFEARTFGNTVHAFLEAVTKRLAQGLSADEMLKEVASWEQRISAVLRSDGLSSVRVQQLAPRVKSALENMLQDAEGLWILGTRGEAFSELALTSWSEARRSVRFDRIFRAGAIPLATGDKCLWIIDYKTAAHGGEAHDEFLAAERAKYGPQMETYARMIKGAAQEVRVGLYYPMLSKLVWWIP
jgi:ATP-dependent exoDNAse (exonuclease V) beta subunit